MGIRRILNLFLRKDKKYISDIESIDFDIQLCRATSPNTYLNNIWLDNILFRLDCDINSIIFKNFKNTFSYIDINVYSINDNISFISFDSYHIFKLFDIIPRENKSNEILISLIDELSNYLENIEDSSMNSDKSFEMINTIHPSLLRSISEFRSNSDIDIYGYTWLDNKFRVKGLSTRFYLPFEYIYLYIKRDSDIKIPYGVLVENIDGYIVKMNIQDFVYMYESNNLDILTHEQKESLSKIMKSESIYFSNMIPLIDISFDETTYIDNTKEKESEEDTDFDTDTYYQDILDEILK